MTITEILAIWELNGCTDGVEICRFDKMPLHVEKGRLVMMEMGGCTLTVPDLLADDWEFYEEFEKEQSGKEPGKPKCTQCQGGCFSGKDGILKGYICNQCTRMFCISIPTEDSEPDMDDSTRVFIAIDKPQAPESEKCVACRRAEEGSSLHLTDGTTHIRTFAKDPDILFLLKQACTCEPIERCILCGKMACLSCGGCNDCGVKDCPDCRLFNLT